jgi:hypothetical protein
MSALRHRVYLSFDGVVDARGEAGLCRAPRVLEPLSRHHMFYLHRSEISSKNCSNAASAFPSVASILHQGSEHMRFAADIGSNERELFAS